MKPSRLWIFSKKTKTHKPKKGSFMPFGGFKTKKIISGKNKGKRALWF